MLPVIIALAIRALFQMAVTLGIISLAEKYVLPLINRALAEIIESFGVSEEDAKDIISNEILLFAEQVGVGVVTLRTKIPTKIAERLGFTSKGWDIRKLTGKAADAKTADIPTVETKTALLVASVKQIATKTGGSLDKLSKIATIVLSVFGIPIGLGYLFINVVDDATWPSSAYQKTFQKFLTLFGLHPDTPLPKTQLLSDKMFSKLLLLFTQAGAESINDPYKQKIVPFNRQNLIDLINSHFTLPLIKGESWTFKSATAALILFIKFKGNLPNADAMNLAAPAPIAKLPSVSVPQVKVFTGILTQGALGAAEPFIARSSDLIDSIQELQTAAENNLSQFIISLPGRIIYEIKIVSTITTKDGFKQRGTSQQIIRGYTTAGTPKYKTIVNKFAVIDVFVFTSRNVRTKIESVVLGPVDSVKFQPKANELQIAEQTIKANITTTDISKIETIITDQPPQVVAAIKEPGVTTPTPSVTGTRIVFLPKIEVYSETRFAELLSRQTMGVMQNVKRNNDIVYYEVKTYTDDPRAELQALAEYNKTLDAIKNRAFVPMAPPPPLAPSVTIPPQAQVAAPPAVVKTPTPSVAIPPSNNFNKCNVSSIAEFFDIFKTNYPSVSERSKLYEAFGLGPASWYTGTSEQNIKLLAELKKRSGC